MSYLVHTAAAAIFAPTSTTKIVKVVTFTIIEVILGVVVVVLFIDIIVRVWYLRASF